MKTLFFTVFLLIGYILLPAQQQTGRTLITDVNIFNGKDERIKQQMDILIEGALIREIKPAGTIDKAGAWVINGSGKWLMPGLIDAHWHTFLVGAGFAELLQGDVGFLHTLAASEAGKTLLRGFTTVRDVAGPAFGLKKAIDEGIVSGPRIYPAGAMISQTSGHGDFKLRSDRPVKFGGHPSVAEVLGASTIADGPDEVRIAVREQLRLGASQIKLACGGGIASFYDPLDVNEFGTEEIKAAVQAAGDWGTYVTVHIYTPEGIIRAVNAGVKCIEHGNLANEEAIKLIAEKGVWCCMQPLTDTSRPQYDADRNAKLKQAAEGTNRVFALAKKYHVKLAFGTDKLFSRTAGADQNNQLVKMLRWFTPFEVLRMATSANGELLQLSGNRNPYPGKQLGIIEEGAYADMIVLNDNPLQKLEILKDPEHNMLLIIKNGVIYKNLLP
ncbi:MAG TPA: amidohydrolase family protein [Chitinophaga sp.]|uniref:metal-dependent hydrolase family protein n=1 Tax=Chitinophaga sp. TaxID=1869181 RepID=UPI002BACCF84|nr:amidohydrolase family protein [Chitinophaga sp.]HVI46649.1 amidohydrolase family protein [Chitinophaga sp.]